MSLTSWDLAADEYDHTELSNNFVLVDAHDHSTGKGVQVPTGGIANLAVTTAKLADGAVTTAKIADEAITYAKIASAARPWSLGDIKYQWFPSGGSSIVGSEWAVADGSTLTTGNHDWNGGVGSVTLPNLIGRFPYGVIEGGVGTTGGANSLNLAHQHAVDAHSHTVAAHTHSISSDGSHNHEFGGAVLVTRQNAFLGGIEVEDTSTFARQNTLQSVFSPAFSAGASPDTDDVVMDADGAHTHTGATGSASPSTNTASPNTSSALGSTDTRPAYVGLLPLIRIRN